MKIKRTKSSNGNPANPETENPPAQNSANGRLEIVQQQELSNGTVLLGKGAPSASSQAEPLSAAMVVQAVQSATGAKNQSKVKLTSNKNGKNAANGNSSLNNNSATVINAGASGSNGPTPAKRKKVRHSGIKLKLILVRNMWNIHGS